MQIVRVCGLTQWVYNKLALDGLIINTIDSRNHKNRLKGCFVFALLDLAGQF